MSKLQVQNELATLLKEPFDIEGDLYSSILKKLTSEQGILVPCSSQLPIVDIDNLLEAQVRNNLYKIPLSTKENSFKDMIKVDSQSFLRIQVEQKSVEREICEIVNNLEMSPHDHLDSLINTFYGELQNKMVEMLSKNKLDLVAERLKLWNIDVNRKFDLYCLNYDQLPAINFGVYNLYNLEQGLANFTEAIPNSQLFLGNEQYLNNLLIIQHRLMKTSQWYGSKIVLSPK